MRAYVSAFFLTKLFIRNFACLIFIILSVVVIYKMKWQGDTMVRVNWVLLSLLLVGIQSANAKSPKPADKILAYYQQLVVGEFDNYNQVNFERNDFLSSADKPKKAHERLYKKVSKINAPELGEHVYLHQIHSGGKDKAIYRQSIEVVHFDAKTNQVIAENYRFKNKEPVEVTATLTIKSSDLKNVGENCHTNYQIMTDTFVGGIDKNQCQVASKKFGHLNLSTIQVVGKDEVWHLEEGFLPSGKMLFGREDNIPIKMRRAKNFKCWAAFKTDKLKENGEPHWDFFPNLIVHNQGDIAEFTTTETSPKQYFFRLKETIFPAGKRPDVFELFVHKNNEQAKKHYNKALAYTWSNADAKRLGINLVGCRLVAI